MSLQRPSLTTYAPSDLPAASPGSGVDSLVRSRVVTLDARDPDAWVRFSFSRAGVVDPGDDDWDLAARRFHLVVNGGDPFPGTAGALDLGDVPFDRVTRVPREGYLPTESGGGEPRHPALQEWYRYSFFSHLLRPEPRTYAIRTADGRYAKLRLLSYYCPGAEPGCLTFRYAFQGDGGTSFVPTPPSTDSATHGG